MITKIMEDRDERITIVLKGYQFNALVSHLVSDGHYIMACLLLRQFGMTLPEAIAFYKGMPEYKENES